MNSKLNVEISLGNVLLCDQSNPIWHFHFTIYYWFWIFCCIFIAFKIQFLSVLSRPGVKKVYDFWIAKSLKQRSHLVENHMCINVQWHVSQIKHYNCSVLCSLWAFVMFHSVPVDLSVHSKRARALGLQ